MPPPSDAAHWPELPFAAWKDNYETLHLWTQVIGKVRLALTPWLNHSWHVTLLVTARGLGTPPIAANGRAAPSSSILSTTCCGFAPATAMCASSCCGR